MSAVAIIGPQFYGFNPDTNERLAFGKVYAYESGTSIPKDTYTDETATVANTNPVILNGAGYAGIYLSGTYKIVLTDANDNEIWTADPVSDPSQLGNQWVFQQPATQISANSFSLSGDQTSNYVEGRAIRLQDGSFLYGHITGSTLNDGETIVTINANEALTSGLESVAVSIIESNKNLPQSVTATGSQSNDEALDQRIIYVDSISDLDNLATSLLVDRQQVSVASSGFYEWKESTSEFIPVAIYKNVLSADNLSTLRAIPVSDLRDGQECSVTSYRSGWAATSFGPMGGGDFVWSTGDYSTGTGTGDIENDPRGIKYVAPDSDTTGASGAWIRKTHGRIESSWAGVYGNDLDDDAPILKDWSDFCIRYGLPMVLSSVPDAYRLSTQWEIRPTETGDVTSIDLISAAEVVVKSYVTGATRSLGHSGYGIIFNSLRNSKFGGFTYDYSNGTGGISFRCLYQSCYANTITFPYLVGGAGVTDRENADKVSAKFTGNEIAGDSENYVCYFNRIVRTRFNIAYQHIRYELGDGNVGNTDEPNANHSHECQFERYIIAVDMDEADECRHTDAWFNSAAGVAGLNGGFTDCFRSNGFGNVMKFTAEPGTSTRPYNLRGSAVRNMIDMLNNCGLPGEDASGSVHTIIDRSDITAGKITASEMNILRAYSVGGLPAPGANENGFVVVTNESGGRVTAFSDGTDWRRTTDRNVVS